MQKQGCACSVRVDVVAKTFVWVVVGRYWNCFHRDQVVLPMTATVTGG